MICKIDLAFRVNNNNNNNNNDNNTLLRMTNPETEGKKDKKASDKKDDLFEKKHQDKDSRFNTTKDLRKKKFVDALQLHWMWQLGAQFGSQDALFR